MRPNRVGLKNQAQAALLCGNFKPARRVKHDFAADFDLALVRTLKAGDRAQQRRFAAAGGAEQSEDFALL